MRARTPLPGEVPEQDALATVLASSEVFRSFYAEVRPLIVRPILWVHEPALPPGILFRVTGTPGHSLVQFTPVSITLEYAGHVAHELLHLLDHETGFPSTAAAEGQAANTCCALNSMLQDPLIDRRLRERGFDVRSSFVEEERYSEEALRHEALPTDRLRVAHWTFNRLGDALDWEYAVRREDDPARTGFIDWFDSRFPALGAHVDRIRGYVESVGFETPERMADVMNYCIDWFQLDGPILRPRLDS